MEVCYCRILGPYRFSMMTFRSLENKLHGYEDGVVPSLFYAERRFKYCARQYRPLSWPLWQTEFLVARRDVDHDVLPSDVGYNTTFSSFT